MGMLIQPVLRPVLQPVLRSIFDPGIGGGVGCAAVITFAGMGLLLIGGAVWHEIQVWRGKR